MIGVPTKPRRAPRSDAIENRARLLVAARDAFVERGPGVPLEEVARRAGCGIATLYRRFPDRTALMRAVIVDALERTIEQARRAADEEPDAFAALVRYMHAVLDLRTAAVIPALLGSISLTDDPELLRVRSQGAQEVERLITAAHRAGTLRADVTFADVGLLVVRLSRPLPGAFSREQNDALAHRHLDLVVAGLRIQPAEAVLPGPALTLDDLRRLPPVTAEGQSAS